MQNFSYLCTLNLENYTLMKKIVSILSACLLSMGLWAVPASPELIEVTQADGSVIKLKMVGDEFYHYFTRPDGSPVSLNKKGMWVDDASVTEMPAAARKIRKANQEVLKVASYPLSGSPKSLVILVNFQNMKFKYKLEDFQKMLTESGYSENGAIGSARDYFIASSDSVFAPQFDCYGPYTISQDYEYYGGHTSSGNDANAAMMIVEACQKAAEAGVDLTQYDTDGDGRLDNVFVYYAGHNEAEHGGENTIWPHRSKVMGDQRVQGKRIYDYACTSELRGASGTSMCGIGTFCHEFGHVLGLPDYYDTDYQYYTIGDWSIMCNGSYNGNGKTPPSYTAGERFQLGWSIPEQLDREGSYTVEPVETSNKIYLLAKDKHNLNFDLPNQNEYWLLENRQHVGWDANANCLTATGLLIWHINYSSSAWGSNRPNNSKPFGYCLDAAGGDKGFSAASDPYPGSRNVRSFTPTLYSGEVLEQPITGIMEANKNIVFTFKSSDFMFLPTELPTIESSYNPDTEQSYTPASKLILSANHLDPEQEVKISISGGGFAISFDSLTWKKELSTSVLPDSTMEQLFYVRYSPSKMVCDIKSGTITASQDATAATYVVHATSPRPVSIEAPQLSDLTEVTPTSFKVAWDAQKDAENYYVTLYHMEAGSESLMESFEGFDDEAVVFESGWYTSFYRTTTKAKYDGAESMWFKTDGEHMITPLYPLPVVELSMWISAPATTDSEVGWIILSGYSDTGIDVIDTIRVSKTTKKYTYTRTFETDPGYRRFELTYAALGGEGVCLDAFTTTFNQKTVYTYKGREMTIPAENGTTFYAYDLTPNTTYYVRLQCSENKGCEEHLSALSEPTFVFTKEGEAVDSKHLTYDVDSIVYNPAKRVIYIPQSLTDGCLNIYSPQGELVKSIPVAASQNVVPLDDDYFRRGTMYMIKYMPNNKMGRKTPWIKIICR